MPKVNPEIWTRIRQGPFRKHDLRFFVNAQKAVTKSAFAATKQILKLEKGEN